MEQLLSQECATESQLETYKSQLSLVEQQLERTSETDAADLKQLRQDLSQLISLTEESLMDVKKQRLLLSLQGMDSCAAQREEDVRKETVEEEERKEDAEDDDLRGVRCRAPVEETWGAVDYHNAVILCKETERKETDEESLMVRVLFTHPTHKAMKPCTFYLQGSCRFDDETCNFSHGHIVPFSDLTTYQDPDYSLVSIGGKCIAKYSDGLWYPAIISSFDEVFTVHFTALNSTVQAALEDVFPLESSESSSSESEEEEEEDGGGEEVVGREEVVVEWTPSGAQRALGDWEKHTTGIGSRLLAKMGYVIGKGLGKHGEGRVEPVEIRILPAGKSLDVCAELREAGKIRRGPGEEGKGGRKRKRRKLVDVSGLEQAKEEKVNVFDFLNAKLRKQAPSAVEARRSSGASSGNLNVQLFTVQEEIKSVLKRRRSLLTQLARHKGKDKTMEEHVTEKLGVIERQLEGLQREEKIIEKSLALKNERKKLRIF